ncbi:MAG: CHAD domain-containing protein [Anaerolineae bacterium]|nr:CHAD domain-containing protein [Anaerolineae bacterium]MDW8172070.1 CHAD domain-containing protein [Anaerolineae bacterium]
MSYTLKADEWLDDGLRRIVQAQSQIILEGLARTDEPHKGLYEARKAFKRLRALLRLVRTSIGEVAYHRANERLRRCANDLAPARDGYVVAQSLAAHLAKLDNPAPYQAVHQRWLAEADAQLAAVLSDPDLRQRLSDDLEVLGHEADEWRLWPRDGFALVAADLRATYRAGRRTMKALQARPDSSPEAFHEWRKRVKRLWYHLTLFRELEGLEALIQQADDLGEQLGLAHDQVVLEAKLRQQPEDLRALIAMAQVEARRLEQEALSLGAALYAQRPNEFLARMWMRFAVWRARRAA